MSISIQFFSLNFLIFTLFFSTEKIDAFSLLDRVHSRKDVRTLIPDFRTTDADVGMRSAHFIGSFRGQPIKTRQHHAFIDDNGVPIPLLPFVDNFSKESESEKPHHPTEKQMARERKVYKWAKEKNLTGASEILRRYRSRI